MKGAQTISHMVRVRAKNEGLKMIWEGEKEKQKVKLLPWRGKPFTFWISETSQPPDSQFSKGRDFKSGISDKEADTSSTGRHWEYQTLSWQRAVLGGAYPKVRASIPIWILHVPFTTLRPL